MDLEYSTDNKDLYQYKHIERKPIIFVDNRLWYVVKIDKILSPALDKVSAIKIMNALKKKDRADERYLYKLELAK